MLCQSPIEFVDELYKNRIYTKREDKLPLSYGGNKVRFSQAFVAHMRQLGKTALVAYGSKSSNLCRVLAQLCKQESIPCAVVFSEDHPTRTNNSEIVSSLGVREYACDKSSVAQTVDKAMADLRAEGYDPYYIYGDRYGKGNELTPVTAYKKVYDEIVKFETEQQLHFDYIFLAVGTAASYSGLLCRAQELSHNRNILGISVARPQAICEEIIRENLKLYLGTESNAPVKVTDEYLQGGYGQHTPEQLEEIDHIFARYNLPLDPTYTGKAWYGMKKTIEKTNIKDKNILFIHTGGYPLFCDYKNILL